MKKYFIVTLLVLALTSCNFGKKDDGILVSTGVTSTGTEMSSWAVSTGKTETNSGVDSTKDEEISEKNGVFTYKNKLWKYSISFKKSDDLVYQEDAWSVLVWDQNRDNFVTINFEEMSDEEQAKSTEKFSEELIENLKKAFESMGGKIENIKKSETSLAWEKWSVLDYDLVWEKSNVIPTRMYLYTKWTERFLIIKTLKKDEKFAENDVKLQAIVDSFIFTK